MDVCVVLADEFVLVAVADPVDVDDTCAVVVSVDAGSVVVTIGVAAAVLVSAGKLSATAAAAFRVPPGLFLRSSNQCLAPASNKVCI